VDAEVIRISGQDPGIARPWTTRREPAWEPVPYGQLPRGGWVKAHYQHVSHTTVVPNFGLLLDGFGEPHAPVRGRRTMTLDEMIGAVMDVNVSAKRLAELGLPDNRAAWRNTDFAPSMRHSTA
jgi:hypothetical protein